MDEIALLQQQLAAVQQQESALKLSDHNVIDLLAKLQQLGKIQVVHTLTGKQFLTPTQIEREIQDYVTLHAGRISMSELTQLINVDRSYVEKYVAQLVRNKRTGSGSVYYIVNSGEEVVTNWYLDAIMEDTNTLLQELGTCTIGALAQQFGFAVDYMRDVVATRLGVILHAQERNNVLYTHSYVASQRAQIRGVFSAATRPTFVPDVARTFGFDERVVDDTLHELVAARALMGSLRGREYVPFVFIDAQRASIYSFFQQNGYLLHARALQLQVTRAYDFLKRKFPDAVPLTHCVVSHALVLQLDGSVDAAVTDASVLDIRSVLPSAIPVSDAAMLLTKCAALARGSATAVQIHDVFAVSHALLDAAVQRLEADAAARARKAVATASTQHQMQQMQQRGSGALKDATSGSLQGGGDYADDDGDSDDDGGKRGGGKRGGGSKKTSKASTADDDKRAKRGSGGGKITKSGKKSKRGDDSAATGGSGSSKRASSSASSSSAVSITPTRDELAELLVSWFPQLDDDAGLLDGVCDHLALQVDTLYATALSTALSSVLRGDAVSLRELRKRFEDQFDDALALLTVLDKGVTKLAGSVDIAAASGTSNGTGNADNTAAAQLHVVECHVLESVGVQLAALATSFVVEANSLEMDGVPPLLSVPASADGTSTASSQSPSLPAMTHLSDANKKVLESNLPAATASALVRLWTFAVAGRRSLSDLMTHVPVLADALSMPLRKLDRKRERQVVFAYRHSVVAELDAVMSRAVLAGADTAACSNTKAATAALLLQLLFQQATGLPAMFPKHTISFGATVLHALRASIPPAPMAKLTALVALARGDASRDDKDDDDDAAAWRNLVADVRTLVTAKDIASA